MLNKNELRDILRRSDIRPNRRLGQNFLVDRNMQRKILRSCGLSCGDIVLEIGPGLGALTFDMARGVKELFAVEKDSALADALKSLAREAGCDNVRVITQDMLKFDIARIYNKKRLKVVGNLPYYITSPIISLLIENRRFIDSIYLTVQKEVGMRLAARPGCKDYSPLSIYTQFYTEPRYLYKIAKGVFFPQPKVDSAFIKLCIPETPRIKVKNEELFFKVVRTAFSKRRKTVLNALASGDILGSKKEDVKALLKHVSIDPQKRPEELSLQDFATIADALRIPGYLNT